MNSKKRFLNLFIISIFLFSFCACAKSAPKCSDAQTQQLVREIVGDLLSKELGTELANQFEFELDVIRTTKSDGKTGKQDCACDLILKGPWGESKSPITYTSELTDEKDKFFVQVSNSPGYNIFDKIKPAPKCADAQIQQLVKEIVSDLLSKDFGTDLANQFEFELNTINTREVNDRIGKAQCSCELIMNGPWGELESPIIYSSELGDKINEIKVRLGNSSANSILEKFKPVPTSSNGVIEFTVFLQALTNDIQDYLGPLITKQNNENMSKEEQIDNLKQYKDIMRKSFAKNGYSYGTTLHKIAEEGLNPYNSHVFGLLQIMLPYYEDDKVIEKIHYGQELKDIKKIKLEIASLN